MDDFTYDAKMLNYFLMGAFKLAAILFVFHPVAGSAVFEELSFTLFFISRRPPRFLA